MRQLRLSAAIRSVAIFSLIVGLLTVVREQVVAFTFGVSDDADVLATATTLPLFCINVLASSMASACIPVMARLRAQQGESVAADFAGTALTVALLGSVVLCFLLAPLLPSYFRLIAAGFSEPKRASGEVMAFLLLPTFFLGSISALTSGFINLSGKFSITSITPGLIPLATVIFILGGFSRFGIFSAIAGIFVGYLAQAVINLLYLFMQYGKMIPSLSRFKGELRESWHQYLPLVLGAALMASTPVLDQAMAAALLPGSVATLNFGGILATLLAGFGARAVGGPMLVYFSKYVAERRWQEIERELRRVAGYCLCASLPIAIILFGFSIEITEIIFSRGAFDESSVLDVALVQRMFSLQIPIYAASIVVVRAMSALGLNKAIFRIAAANVLLNAILNYVLMKGMGVAGIALATSIVLNCSAIFCWVITIRHLRNLVSSDI